MEISRDRSQQDELESGRVARRPPEDSDNTLMPAIPEVSRPFFKELLMMNDEFESVLDENQPDDNGARLLLLGTSLNHLLLLRRRPPSPRMFLNGRQRRNSHSRSTRRVLNGPSDGMGKLPSGAQHRPKLLHNPS